MTEEAKAYLVIFAGLLLLVFAVFMYKLQPPPEGRLHQYKYMLIGGNQIHDPDCWCWEEKKKR